MWKIERQAQLSQTIHGKTSPKRATIKWKNTGQRKYVELLSIKTIAQLVEIHSTAADLTVSRKSDTNLTGKLREGHNSTISGKNHH